MSRIRPRDLLLLVTVIALGVWGAAVTLPHSFSSGEIVSATQMNENFAALENAIAPLEAFDATLASTPCPSGEALAAVARDGTPGCVAVSGGTGLSAVTHDDTLAGDGSAAAPLSVAQQSAASGQVLEWNGSSWAPAADDDTRYSAGSGLQLSGTTFSLADRGVDGSKLTVPLTLAASSSKALEVTGNGGGIANAALRAINGAGGIGLWVLGTKTGSSDAAMGVSQSGNGPFFKAFGPNGGNEEVRINSNGTVFLFKSNATTEADFNIKLDNGNGAITASAFNTSSDRNLKVQFTAVDGGEVLERLASIPIGAWSFRNEPSVRHLGPTAQDFRAAFGLGADARHIATVDADGVALAAIQALHRENLTLRAQLASLESRLGSLEAARDSR